MDEAVEQLGEVLEVPELGEGGDVAGERAGVEVVEPQRGGVEPLPVRLARAAHAAEVGDELERRERVARPRCGDELTHAGGRRVGDHVEEEVEAGVAGVGEGAGRLPRRRLRGGGGGGVEAGVEKVEERVGGGGVVGVGGGGGASGADGGRAEEDGSHGEEGMDRSG
nr:unnamed protein product [Digitaria exilis]